MIDTKQLKELRDVLIEKRLIYNNSDWANQIGKPRSYVSEALNGRRAVTEQFVLSIAEAFPQVNRDWLLTGRGEMLHTLAPDTPNDALSFDLPALREALNLSVAELAETLNVSEHALREVDNGEVPPTPDLVARVRSYVDITNPDLLHLVDGVSISFSKCITVYSSQTITASNIPEMPQNLSEVDYWYIPGLEGCTAIRATGASMEPTIREGWFVIIQPWSEKYIQNGELYVLITTTGNQMVKRLRSYPNDDTRIACISDNPNKALYSDFDVQTADIVRIYRVRATIPTFL